jgi:hypothetical protein
MPVEQRGRVTDVRERANWQQDELQFPAEGGSLRFGDTSRMTRECQVRICERLGAKFPGPTRHYDSSLNDKLEEAFRGRLSRLPSREQRPGNSSKIAMNPTGLHALKTLRQRRTGNFTQIEPDPVRC